jgi:predicted nucleotidyltransferase
MKREVIIDRIREQEAELRRMGVARLCLFGSAARGQADAESDLDFLVAFEGTADYDRYITLKFFLEDLLGKPVDLVMETALKPRIRSRVESEMVRVA